MEGPLHKSDQHAGAQDYFGSGSGSFPVSDRGGFDYLACDRCRRSRIKCTAYRPCAACKKTNRLCKDTKVAMKDFSTRSSDRGQSLTTDNNTLRPSQPPQSSVAVDVAAQAYWQAVQNLHATALASAGPLQALGNPFLSMASPYVVDPLRVLPIQHSPKFEDLASLSPNGVFGGYDPDVPANASLQFSLPVLQSPFVRPWTTRDDPRLSGFSPIPVLQMRETASSTSHQFPKAKLDRSSVRHGDLDSDFDSVVATLSALRRNQAVP